MSGKHHCVCGARMVHHLDESTDVVLVGCINANCPWCLLKTNQMHEAIGKVLEANDAGE